MALHWVVHNRPDLLDVRYIFDDVRVVPNGSQVGGAGKLDMYTARSDVVLETLDFPETPLLIELIRDLFLLFQSLANFNHSTKSGGKPGVDDVKNVKKLRNCRVIVQFMKEAATREDWLDVDDRTEVDNYPCKVVTDQKDLVGKAHVRVSIYTGGEFIKEEEEEGSLLSKRGPELEDEAAGSPKRPRISR